MGFSKQRKKPGSRRSSNRVQNAFFRLSPSGRNEKTPLRSNSTRSVSYHHFGWASPSSAKSRVDEDRPIALKTRFFGLSPSGRNEKIPLRSNSTRSVQYRQKAGVTKVVQMRSKHVFLPFPIGAKLKNIPAIDFHEVGFIPPFWVGFSNERKKAG